MRLADRYNLIAVLRDRADQPSFHISSEPHIRVQFFNFAAHQGLDFSYEGNVVITCFRGSFSLNLNGSSEPDLNEMDQMVVHSGVRVDLRCIEAGWVQVLWCPPFAVSSLPER